MRLLGILGGAAVAATAVVACGGGRQQVSPVAPAWLDQKVDQQAKVADPSGTLNGEVMHGVAYATKEFTEWLVHFDNQHCYWISGVADEGIDKLSVYLWDPKGSRVDSDKAAGASIIMKYCPTETGPYKIQGKSGKGAGHFSFGTYAVAPEAAAPPPAVAAKVDLGPLVEQQAASAAPGATRSGDFFTGAGDQSEWTVALAPGNCYWFIGVGEPGKVKRLEIYLWDPKQKRLSESHNENNVGVAGHCPTVPGMYKFQAKVQSGSGEYKVGVYSKKQ